VTRLTPLDEYVQLTPGLAFGEDAIVDLTGDVSVSGWTLAVYASYVENGPVDASLSGISVSYVGGGTYVIRITIPAAATAPLTAECTMYLEVWRTDSGQHRPLRRVKVDVYDPVRAAS